MSDFDRTVLEWLNGADIPAKSKTAVLNRSAAGIKAYRALLDDASNSASVTDNKMFSALDIDLELEDVVARTQRRLDDGEEPIALLPVRVPKLAVKKTAALQPQRRAPSAAAGHRPGTASARASMVSKPTGMRRANSGAATRTSVVKQQQQAAPAPAKKEEPKKAAPAKKKAAASPAADNKKAEKKEEKAAEEDAKPAEDDDSPFGADEGDDAPFAFGDANEESGGDKQHVAWAEDDANQTEVIDDEEDSFRRKSMMTKRMSRQAVSAEVLNATDVDDATFEPVAKPDALKARAFTTLETHPLFNHFDDAYLNQFVDIMKVAEAAEGEKLITKFDTIAAFYLVDAAQFAAADGSDASEFQVASSTAQVLKTVGDRSLMYEQCADYTYAATVGGAAVLSLDRATFKVLSERASKEKRARYEGFLGKVKFLNGLDGQQKLQLADSLKVNKFEQGAFLIRHGEPGAQFFIIEEGTVEVIGRDENGAKMSVCTFTVGDCIGELEFLFEHDAVADVVAKSATVRTAAMMRNHFERVIGDARKVLEDQAENDEVFNYYREARRRSSAPQKQ
jgi:CRP-like cAMP-binding protein